jgi:hypothetical protein
LDGCVEPVSVVDHVEDEVGLLGERDYLLPVAHGAALEAHQFSVADVVKLCVFDAGLDL